MNRLAPYCLLPCIILAGCTQTRNTTANLARENEQRLASLEESVNALNSQIAQLNNRVYEVRTKSGQKTSMTVVPIVPGSTGIPAPVSSVHPPSTPPAGKVVSPHREPVKPKTAPSKVEPVKTVKSQPANLPDMQPVLPAESPVASQAGPSGRVGAQELPPPQMPAEDSPVTQIHAPASNVTISPQTPAETSAPSSNIPVPQGNVPELPSESASPLVPVPLLPSSELIVPAESAPQKSAQPVSQPRQVKSSAQGEQAAYNTALNAARSGRTAEGIRLFREFLQKYPNGRYAANADYWIGECLFAQGKYQEALTEFNQVNSAYPAHHKNADALLKAGITMSKMGDKEGAQAKFKTVIANFPNSEAARRAKAMGVN